MPISVTCPSCGEPMRVKDEYAGKVGKCRSCGERFQVPELDTESDSESSSADVSSGDVGAVREALSWEPRRLGLEIGVWAAITGLIGTILAGVASSLPSILFNNTPGRFEPPSPLAIQLVFVLMATGGIAIIFQLVLVTTASFLFGRSEERDESPGLAFGAGIMFLVSVGVLILGFATITGGRTWMMIVSTGSVLVYLAAYAAIALDVGNVAESLGRPGLRKSSLGFVGLQGAIAVWHLVSTFLLSGSPLSRGVPSPMSGGELGMFNLIIWTVVFVVHFFWFRDLVRQTASVVQEKQRGLLNPGS